jgi:hypothetical protein
MFLKLRSGNILQYGTYLPVKSPDLSGCMQSLWCTDTIFSWFRAGLEDCSDVRLTAHSWPIPWMPLQSPGRESSIVGCLTPDTRAASLSNPMAAAYRVWSSLLLLGF